MYTPGMLGSAHLIPCETVPTSVQTPFFSIINGPPIKFDCIITKVWLLHSVSKYLSLLHSCLFRPAGIRRKGSYHGWTWSGRRRQTSFGIERWLWWATWPSGGCSAFGLLLSVRESLRLEEAREGGVWLAVSHLQQQSLHQGYMNRAVNRELKNMFTKSSFSPVHCECCLCAWPVPDVNSTVEAVQKAYRSLVFRNRQCAQIPQQDGSPALANRWAQHVASSQRASPAREEQCHCRMFPGCSLGGRSFVEPFSPLV